MKEITLEELKVLQMDILSAIDKFCTENSITYSLAGGTLLGAIRHKGYIPWDDDIDIYLYRDDYQKLIEGFPELYEGRYKISSLERNKEWFSPYAKAYDAQTVFMENHTEKASIGVNIDVYPIDSVPDDEKLWKRYDKRRRRLQNLYRLKCNDLNKHWAFKKNLGLFVVHIFTFFISKRWLGEFLSRYAQKFNNDNTSYVFSNAQGWYLKNRFKKEVFKSVIETPFEDRKFKAFSNYDEYLRNAYGDYMKLPPVEKRKTHHVWKAYWK